LVRVRDLDVLYYGLSNLVDAVYCIVFPHRIRQVSGGRRSFSSRHDLRSPVEILVRCSEMISKMENNLLKGACKDQLGAWKLSRLNISMVKFHRGNSKI
jgi:hypothetical protein